MPEKFEGITPPQESKKNREKVDFDKLEVGMKIKIRQPEGKVYDTSSDADVGQGGIHLKEEWIETTIKDINKDPDDQFVTTVDNIREESYFVDDFSPEEMWYENGVLHADPTIDD
ncbi:hypothetical protein GF382_00490 [Candidatus Falkowbacteria bacterium]|nr:hypothetical protein [Candidatus Falkowbacteria bacterium]